MRIIGGGLEPLGPHEVGAYATELTSIAVNVLCQTSISSRQQNKQYRQHANTPLPRRESQSRRYSLVFSARWWLGGAVVRASDL